jgi:hypothetical protein
MPQVKCEYCGAFIDETADKCPNCGGVNKNFKRIVSDTPQTIEELQDWYRARKLPDENITRFFIGKDIREPKAFGIYKDGSNYIVYKNKADGSRAVRYQGTDEAYAVNELYMKLKSEILNQKSRSMNRTSSSKNSSTLVGFFVPIVIAFVTILTFFQNIIPLTFIILMFGLFLGGLFIFHRKPVPYIIIAIVVMIACSASYIIGYKASHRYDGYYFNGQNYYYRQGNDVYYYDNGWGYYDTYDDFIDYYPDSTFVSDEYSYNENYTDFSDSSYYEDHKSSSNSSDWDSDSDYDWDSGSDWDSGGSDWDSDW